MAEYLLLWSGECRGMNKTRIPAVPATGFLHDNGLAPCRDAIRENLPARLRPAFARSAMSRRAGAIARAFGDDKPLIFALHNARGKWITNLYLQPLKEGAI